jgi:hypothetical protein
VKQSDGSYAEMEISEKTLAMEASDTNGYEVASDYVKNNLATHVYIVDRSTMEKWLSPTLWAIPRLCHEEVI